MNDVPEEVIRVVKYYQQTGDIETLLVLADALEEFNCEPSSRDAHHLRICDDPTKCTVVKRIITTLLRYSVTPLLDR